MKLARGTKIVIGKKVYKGEVPDAIAEKAGLLKPKTDKTDKTEKKSK